MEKVKRHFRKSFGDASTKQVLALCGSCSYMSLPASQVAQLLNIAEAKDRMHTLRDEPDCQLNKSCSKGNAAILKMNELVGDTYHVARTLSWEVLDMKCPRWPPISDVSEAKKSVKVPNLVCNVLTWLV